MEFKDLDYLSQKISLNFYGKERHSSLYGSILTIIMAVVCAIYILYLVMNVLLHNSLDYNSYKKYVKNPGNFSFANDINGIFHYFRFLNAHDNQFIQFNPKYIRVFMTRIYNGYKTNFESLNESEHWVYDICREEIDDKKIPKDVFSEQNNIKNCACLRYYYNNINKQYYSIDDVKNFKFPSLNSGTGSSDLFYLNTVVEKCHNDSLLNSQLGECGNTDDINNYVNNIGGIYMELLEQQIETENHLNQIFSYLNSVPASMDNSDIPINDINLSPLEIKIKSGVVFPKTKKKLTYTFNNNRVSFYRNKNKSHILSVFNYWLINTAQVFKGGFNTLYDVLPSVGGIFQLCYYIFFAVNFLINQFTIMQDSKRLFFQMKGGLAKINEEERRKFAFALEGVRSKFAKIQDNKEIINKIKNTKEEIESTQYKNQKKILKGKRNFYRFSPFKKSKDVSLTINNNRFENDKNDDYSKKDLNANNISFSLLNKRDNINDIKNENENEDIIPTKELNFKTVIKLSSEKNKPDPIFGIVPGLNTTVIKRNDDYTHFSQNLTKFISNKKNNIKLESVSTKDLENYTTPFYFLISLFSKKSKIGKTFYIINKFRKKLLSEEHIFRTHIILYYFEKFFDIIESEKIDITELYNYL